MANVHYEDRWLAYYRLKELIPISAFFFLATRTIPRTLRPHVQQGQFGMWSDKLLIARFLG